MPNASAGERALRQLQASLGGTDRAAAQTRQALERLNTAYRTGAVGVSEYLRLQSRIAQQFTTQAVAARGLQGTLAGLNTQMRAMAGQMATMAGAGGLSAALPFGLGGGATAALAGGAAFVGIARAGDQMRLARAQLEAFLGSTEDADRALQSLIQTANQTGTSLGSNVELFRRLAIAQQDLGASTQDLIDFQRTVQQLMIASGTGTVEAAQATRQLAQAMASGRVQGDEFRTIMESVPVLAQKAAKGLFEMGKLTEPTIGALNRLRSEGKLTAEDFFQALLRMSGEAQDLFRQMPETLARASQRMQTNLTLVAAELDSLTGAAFGSRSAIGALADVLGEAAERLAGFRPATTVLEMQRQLRQARKELAETEQQTTEQAAIAPQLPGLAGVGARLGSGLAEASMAQQQARIEEMERTLAFMLAGPSMPAAGLGTVRLPPLPTGGIEARPPTVLDVEIPGQEEPRRLGAAQFVREARESERIKADIEAQKKADQEREAAAKRLLAAQKSFGEAFNAQLLQLTGDTLPEVERIMQQLTVRLDFKPSPEQLESMREQITAALAVRDAEQLRVDTNEQVNDILGDQRGELNNIVRELVKGKNLTEDQILAAQEQVAAAIKKRDAEEAWIESMKRAKEAMREQADEMERLRMTLPGEQLRFDVQQLDATLARMQTPAAGEQQISPEQAAFLRQQQMAEMGELLPQPLKDVRDMFGTAVEGLADFSAELAVGKATLGDFGETMQDVGQQILRQVIEAAVVRPLTQSVTAGLVNVAAGMAGQTAGQAAMGLGGGWGTGAPGQTFYSPTGTPIYLAQHGARARPGQTFVVGEAGPEIFRPRTSGDIIPLHVTPRQFGGHAMARQAILAGEVGPEAFAPRGAPSGGSGGGGSRGGVSVPVDVRVINQGGAQVTPSVRQGAGGRQMIEVLVQDAMASNARSGQLDPMMSMFGGRRRGIQRS